MVLAACRDRPRQALASQALAAVGDGELGEAFVPDRDRAAVAEGLVASNPAFLEDRVALGGFRFRPKRAATSHLARAQIR